MERGFKPGHSLSNDQLLFIETNCSLQPVHTQKMLEELLDALWVHGSQRAAVKLSPVTVPERKTPPTTSDESRSTVPEKNNMRQLLSGLPPMFSWQKKAFESWVKTGKIGIIEAATGTGKTRIALEAIAECCSIGGRVLVLVPTLPLLDQWYQELRSSFGQQLRLGKFNGSTHDSFIGHDVIVASVSSVSRHIPQGLGSDGKTLLVADEVHHYGAPAYSKALIDRFNSRLSLTATFSRNDKGIQQYLLPYFKQICFSYTTRDAVNEGIIAHYNITYVRTKFPIKLQVEYYELCQRIKAAKSKLIAEFSFQENPFGVFLDQVSKAAQETKNSANHLACEYISCFSRRKQMLSEFEGKYTALRLLESVLFSADKTLVFNLTVAGAESSSEILSSLGLRSAVVHSGLHISERNSAMVSFKRGSIKALCAPLVLDEGIDVPAADLAIVIAGNRSMRQFIQRLGRVIRKKTDGRSANIYIMYVEDTLEDPSEYFNQRVYGGIEDGADSINYIDASTGVLKEMKNPVKQGPLIRTLSESTNSKSQYNQQEAILDITTRHIIPNDTVIKIPGTNIDNLSQLLSLLKKESIPFENNRLLNGSIWVYKNDREFGEYAEYLRSLGVSVKYYPHGRSRRAGEQYELDPRKVLK